MVKTALETILVDRELPKGNEKYWNRKPSAEPA